MEGAMALLYRFSRTELRGAGPCRAGVGGGDEPPEPAPPRIAGRRGLVTSPAHARTPGSARLADSRPGDAPSPVIRATPHENCCSGIPAGSGTSSTSSSGLFIAPALHLPGADRRPGRCGCGSRSSSSGAPGSSSARCWRCASTSCPPPTATSCSSCSTRSRPSPTTRSARSSARSWAAARGGLPLVRHESFAAASIGQVHRAVLHTGEQRRGQGPAPAASARSSRPTST